MWEVLEGEASVQDPSVLRLGVAESLSMGLKERGWQGHKKGLQELCN